MLDSIQKAWLLDRTVKEVKRILGLSKKPLSAEAIHNIYRVLHDNWPKMDFLKDVLKQMVKNKVLVTVEYVGDPEVCYQLVDSPVDRATMVIKVVCVRCGEKLNSEDDTVVGNGLKCWSCTTVTEF